MHETGTKHIVHHSQKSSIKWSVICKFACNLNEIMANWYSSDSAEEELSNEYQRGRVWMAFEHSSGLMSCIKLAAALKGFIWYVHMVIATLETNYFHLGNISKMIEKGNTNFSKIFHKIFLCYNYTSHA